MAARRGVIAALAAALLASSSAAAPNPTNCSNAAGAACGPCGPGCEQCGPPLSLQPGAPQYHVHDYSCGENDPNFPFYDNLHGLYHQ